MRTKLTLLIIFLITGLWEKIIAQADWNTLGNPSISSLTNYVGTQNPVDLNFATDYTNQGLFMMRLTTAGRLGIVTLSPGFPLEVDNGH